MSSSDLEPSDMLIRSLISLKSPVLWLSPPSVGRKLRLLMNGSPMTLVTGVTLRSRISRASLLASKPPASPSGVTRLSRSSSDVWYSGKVPYLLRIIETTGRSTPGAQYWRSSLPRSRHPEASKVPHRCFRTCCATASLMVLPALDGMKE